MDVARMREILSQRRETRRWIGNETIRVFKSDEGIVVTGLDPDHLLTALNILTEDEPLYAKFRLVVDEWRAIVSDPSGTHVNVSASTVRDSNFVGAVFNNLEPNQGVQGMFNTPIHIGKK